MIDGSSSTTKKRKGMNRLTKLLVALLFLVQIHSMIIDYRIKQNLHLLQSALDELSLLSGSKPLPNTPTNLRMISEEVRTVANKNASLRRPTPQRLLVNELQQVVTPKTS